MNHGFRLTREKIAQRLALIRRMAFRQRAPLPSFRMLELPDAKAEPPLAADPSDWREVGPGDYWGRRELNFLLKTTTQAPEGFDPHHLVLYLPLGVMGDIFVHPEALVYLNGTPIGSADRHHHVVPIPAGVGPDWDLALHGWTGLVGWPPDRASHSRLMMGACLIAERHPGTEAFLARASAALDSIGQLSDDRPERHRLLTALDEAFLRLDTRDPLGEAFYASVPAAREVLEEGIERAGPPLDVTLIGVGHAHMDIAYLWPVSQIRRKNGRTYANALRLLNRFEDFRFSHSQPQLYKYTEEDYPEIFEGIREQVARGAWEPMGGMWVEADVNIPGPESLVRQLMLGRSYFRDRFGDAETPVLWLPDTFGFPWTLPQLMKHAGLKWFVTNKLNWNQTNQLPASTHWWQGLDGTRVLGHVLTTPREVQHLPFPTNYKSDLSAKEVMGTWTRSTAKDKLSTLPIAYGYGDGGGGPKEDLILTARAYADMPGMPRLKMGTVAETFAEIEAVQDQLPVWNGEHYLEGHRGVLTSQGWIKRANRKAEWALHEAEALAALAGHAPDLSDAWERLCLNQFHDVITGTSITEVFDDARADYEVINAAAEAATRAAVSALVPPEEGFTALNTAPVAANRLAFVPGAPEVPGQAVANGRLVMLPNLKPYEMRPITAETVALPPPVSAEVTGQGAVLENEMLRVEVDARGQLTSVYDKAFGRQVLAPDQRGNVLQMFEDRPVSWDAWDIDSFFEDRLDPEGPDATLTLTETGPLRATVEVARPLRSSRLLQRIRLRAGSKRIDFETQVDWNETHTLLKVAFPVDILSHTATFDIQWGVVERPTHASTPWDAARFEVPAQEWADLSEGDYGVALLNDCKYGYDVSDNCLRLSLIKSATVPDPVSDQGRHVFTYSLLPHTGDWRNGVEAEAADLNAPLRVAPGKAAALPVQVSADHVHLRTLKPAADGTGWILRLAEAEGRRGPVRVTLAVGIGAADVCNFLEDRVASARLEGSSVLLDIQPFEIVSLRVIPANQQ